MKEKRTYITCPGRRRQKTTPWRNADSVFVLDVRRIRCSVFTQLQMKTATLWSEDESGSRLCSPVERRSLRIWLPGTRDVSRHRRGCHKLNRGCRNVRGEGRGRYFVSSLRAGVDVVAMMSGGSHRHSYRLLLVPPKKHEVSCYVSATRSIPQHERGVQHQPHSQL